MALFLLLEQQKILVPYKIVDWLLLQPNMYLQYLKTTDMLLPYTIPLSYRYNLNYFLLLMFHNLYNQIQIPLIIEMQTQHLVELTLLKELQ